MNKFAVILLLSIKLTLSLSTSVDPNDECKKVVEKTPERRLREYLFCKYEPWDLSTLNETNGTEVFVSLAPKQASFNEDDGNLEIFGWMITSWIDPHFKWNLSDFDYLHFLRVHSYEIWNPEIAVLSAGNEDSNVYVLPLKTVCYLLRHGRVICVPQMRHTIRCQTDFTQWPFDRQNCTLVLSTWLRSNEEIHFAGRNDTVIMDYFVSNGEWTLTASRASRDQMKSIVAKRKGVTSPRLSIEFIVDRVHNQLSGRYVSPTIIMMAMTLTTLWLDPRSIERLAVACVNPLIHIFCIQSLHAVLPHNGSTVPSILVFYANSLVLATIALLLTVILANVQEAKSDPPKWMASSTAAILRTRVGQIFLLSMLDPKVAAEVEPDADDSGDLVSSKSPKTAWSYFAIVCGWISFFSILFTYLIMYVVLVPNSSMRPPIKGIGYVGIRY